jgi:hypothetical protein
LILNDGPPDSKLPCANLLPPCASFVRRTVNFHHPYSNSVQYETSGLNALHWAAHEGDTALIQLLLDHGANVDGQTLVKANEPLPDIRSAANVEQRMQMMRERGSRFLNRNYAQTPLQLALLASDHRDAAKFLIERGAAVDLHSAAYLNDLTRLQQSLTADPLRLNSSAKICNWSDRKENNRISLGPGTNSVDGTPPGILLCAAERTGERWIPKVEHHTTPYLGGRRTARHSGVVAGTWSRGQHDRWFRRDSIDFVANGENSTTTLARSDTGRHRGHCFYFARAWRN